MTRVDLMTEAELTAQASPAAEAGCGALGTERGNLPLDEIDLAATITGLAARIELTQGFRNPFPEPLEATYIFPLPDRAAVTALRMEAGGRVVDGVIRERGAARAAYDRAVTEGHRASIAEQDRADVFTMRVGNIMPGERVVVRLSLAGPLPYEDDAATFRFPLVVAPRYIPGTPLPGAPVGDGVEPDTDAVPDASRISPPVLLPGFPNPVRLSARVDVDPAGLALTEVRSSLHTTTVTADDDRPDVLSVRLAPGERADRDFVLRLGFAGGQAIAGSLVVRPDGADRDGTFAITLVPPPDTGRVRPRDVALVLDRSGSMSGWKMVAARRAAARIVDSLTAQDRFTVLSFDNVVERPASLPAGLVPAGDRNRFRAVEHLAALEARGGTEMLGPLTEAIGLLGADPDGARERVLVLVTDGQVGNVDQILHTLAGRLAGVRVHTVGVDTAVHAGFLRSLAALGGGRCELVESEDRLDDAMRAIHHRIGTPLVTDLRIEPAGPAIDAASVAPARLPDLFAGAPVLITGRTNGNLSGPVTVTGRAADGTEWRQHLTAVPSDNGSLPAIWARARIRDLEDSYVTRAVAEPNALAGLERDIIAVSLEFQVLSRFTAFVAVDERVVNEGGVVHRVTQPVELPQGWEMPVAGGPAMAPRLAAAESGREHGFRRLARTTAGRRVPAAELHSRRAAPMSTPMSPPMPAPTPPPMSPPVSPFVGTVPDVRRFAVEARARLRNLATAPFETRAGWLAELAEGITARLDGFIASGLGPFGLRLLRELVTELSGQPADPADLHHRWLRATDVLDALAGDDTGDDTDNDTDNDTGDGGGREPAEDRRRRSFWKR